MKDTLFHWFYLVRFNWLGLRYETWRRSDIDHAMRAREHDAEFNHRLANSITWRWRWQRPDGTPVWRR